MDLREGIETLAMGGKSPRKPLPGLDEAERRHVYFYVLMPNLMLSLHPDYLITHLLRPVACDRTEIVCDFHVLPDEMIRPGFDLSDVIEFWDLTNRQDWHVSELTQLGLRSRSYSPGPYSPTARTCSTRSTGSSASRNDDLSWPSEWPPDSRKRGAPSPRNVGWCRAQRGPPRMTGGPRCARHHPTPNRPRS